MRRVYCSSEDARQTFDAFARLEPRLRPLWALCQNAAPAVDASDDDGELDAFDDDDVETSDWCAEDYFLQHVKAKLLPLVGAYRPGDPDELHSPEAYEAVYDLLINWALNRSCTCCAKAA
jgi:hypothetical protein